MLSSCWGRALLQTHGALAATGYGILLPLGAMVARYGKFSDPLWFYLHIICQISGYVIGTVAFGYGLDLQHSTGAIKYDHRNIGVSIFVFSTCQQPIEAPRLKLKFVVHSFAAPAQLLAICFRPHRGTKYRLYFNIIHHTFGYATIVLAIVNIFLGFHYLAAYHGCRTGYIVFIAVLGGIALVLEVVTWALWLRRRRDDTDSGTVTKPTAAAPGVTGTSANGAVKQNI
eukprot:SM005297S17864  [mRNA]  locus=s5297:60:893:- [translate_table: standard]